jgi:hypothetical protein
VRVRPARSAKAPILVAAHRVDEHHAGGLVGMRMREQARERPAVGAADQDIGRREVRVLQQTLEVGDLVAGVVHAGHREAVAEACAIVGAGARRATECGCTALQLFVLPPKPALRMTVGLPDPAQFR